MSLSRYVFLKTHIILGSRIVVTGRGAVTSLIVSVPRVIVASGTGPVLRRRTGGSVITALIISVSRIIVASGSGPVLRYRIGRAVVARIRVVVAAPVLIDLWIFGVNIAVDDLVVHSRSIVISGRDVSRPAVVPLPVVATGLAIVADSRVVYLHVVVVHIFVHVIVVIDVVDVHRAIDDGSIHCNICVAVVDVDVVHDIHVDHAAIDPPAVPTSRAPSAAPPTRVINAAPASPVTPAETQV